jgi:hypothetical protein
VATDAADPAEALHDRLRAIDDVDLDERPALFEEANAVLAAALAELDEV